MAEQKNSDKGKGGGPDSRARVERRREGEGAKQPDKSESAGAVPKVSKHDAGKRDSEGGGLH